MKNSVNSTDIGLLYAVKSRRVMIAISPFSIF
jgi:hypothetical protein